MQRNFKLRNNVNNSMPNVMALIRWTLMLIMAMVLQQIKITDAAKFSKSIGNKYRTIYFQFNSIAEL